VNVIGKAASENNEIFLIPISPAVRPTVHKRLCFTRQKIKTTN